MFHGVEIDDTMIRIGAMNLQLHGIENPNYKRTTHLAKVSYLRDKYSLI